MKFPKGTFPVVSSIGTLFSSAGNALFGTDKILKYIFGETDNKPNIPPFAHNTIYVIVIAANLVVIAETRVSAIMRKYLKERFNRSEQIIIEAPAVMAPRSHNHLIPPSFSQTLQDVDNRDPENPNYHVLDEPNSDKSSIMRNIVSLRENTDMGLSTRARVAHKVIYASLSSLGFSSVVLSALPSYLGSITFFEFMGGDPNEKDYSDPVKYLLLSLLHFGAFWAMVFKFNVNYVYTYPATQKSALKIANWLVYSRNELDPTRWQDFKPYLPTLAFCALNILSTPFTAYYSTSQTLLKIPFIKNFLLPIKIFSAVSTLSAITSVTLSTTPSVHDSLHKWWYNRDEDSSKINRVYAARFVLIKMLVGIMGVVGLVDSLSTGANSCVSIVNSSNDLFKINRYNLVLMIFAILCSASAALVNAAFSVRRGHRAFIKNEVFDYCQRNLLLERDESQVIVADLQESLLQDDEDSQRLGLSAQPSLLTEEMPAHEAIPKRASSLLIQQIQDDISSSSPQPLRISISGVDSPLTPHAPALNTPSLAMPIPPRAMKGAIRSFNDHNQRRNSLRNGFFSAPTTPIHSLSALKNFDVQSEDDVIDENFGIFGL